MSSEKSYEFVTKNVIEMHKKVYVCTLYFRYENYCLVMHIILEAKVTFN